MNSSLKKNFTQIPNELFQIGNLSTRDIALYCYLKYRAYSGNGILTFPSQKRIMKELKIGSDNTLRKSVRTLIDNDFLFVSTGSNFTGNSIYKLRIPTLFLEDSS